jgi:hypothetical protein
MFVEGVEEDGEVGRRGSEVRVGEQEGCLSPFAGVREAEAEGMALAPARARG